MTLASSDTTSRPPGVSSHGLFAKGVAEARRVVAANIEAAPDEEARALAGPTDEMVAMHGGLEVPVRVTRPPGSPMGVVIFLHGGGYALSSAALSDDICRRLSVGTESVVVAVEYRLAPEAPFPASFHDAIAATRWALASRTELSGRSVPVLLVGESAGANIAASVGIEVGQALAGQVLVVPSPDISAWRGLEAIDVADISPGDLADIVQVAFGGDWDSAATYPASAAASAAIGSSPRSVVALAGLDCTAPVGHRYAELLSQHGVAVEELSFPAVNHLFFGLAHIAREAREAFDDVCVAARRMLTEAA
jgi:acetyl esterase